MKNFNLKPSQEYTYVYSDIKYNTILLKNRAF